jgi:hypothetical protein
MIKIKSETAEKQWKILKAIRDGLVLRNYFAYSISLGDLAEKAEIAKADVTSILLTLTGNEAIVISGIEIEDEKRYNKIYLMTWSKSVGLGNIIPGDMFKIYYNQLKNDDKVTILVGKKFETIFNNLSNSLNKNEFRFPYKLPAGTQWGSIFIKFLDPEKVHIEVVGKKHDTDFVGMGFENRKNSKPDNQWIFFSDLAKNNGEITWETSEAKLENKKTKQLLSDKLKSYFSIDYDPFENYRTKNAVKEKNSYKIKMVLFYAQEYLKSLSENDGLDKKDPRLEGMDEVFA